MSGIHETAASLRFFGDDLDPNEITRCLGRAPSAAERKGDTITNPKTGSKRVARRGSWRLKTERCSPGDLDGQISILLDRLTNDLAVWRRLTSEFKADIFCGLFLVKKNEGLSISPQTSLQLGERGLVLNLDVYGPEK